MALLLVEVVEVELEAGYLLHPLTHAGQADLAAQQRELTTQGRDGAVAALDALAEDVEKLVAAAQERDLAHALVRVVWVDLAVPLPSDIAVARAPICLVRIGQNGREQLPQLVETQLERVAPLLLSDLVRRAAQVGRNTLRTSLRLQLGLDRWREAEQVGPAAVEDVLVVALRGEASLRVRCSPCRKSRSSARP